MQFNPHDMLSVQLNAAQWEAVMGFMGKHPYDQVAGLIAMIQSQCMQQAPQQQAVELGQGQQTGAKVQHLREVEPPPPQEAG